MAALRAERDELAHRVFSLETEKELLEEDVVRLGELLAGQQSLRARQEEALAELELDLQVGRGVG